MKSRFAALPTALPAALVPLAAAVVVALVGLALPATAIAHGYAPAPDSLLSVLEAWQFDAWVVLPLVGAWLLYRWAVSRVNRLHPGNRVPRYRSWCWNSGLLTLLIALCSPIGTYDTTLFSVHMIQHLLLIMVAAPLLALGAPITLIMRVSSAETRRRIILPFLHSRPMRALSFPVTTWILFAAVMWASHFSSLFNASLDNEAIHVFEHGLYLGSALLFWWPVVGADPSPWRLPHPVRIAYLFLGMPQSSFLGLAIFSAPAVLYSHYATLIRNWGPTPLEDQQLAGGLMWVGGDIFFLTALVLAVWVWLRAEENEGVVADAKLEREDAARSRATARTAIDTSRTGVDTSGSRATAPHSPGD